MARRTIENARDGRARIYIEAGTDGGWKWRIGEDGEPRWTRDAGDAFKAAMQRNEGRKAVVIFGGGAT